MLVRIPTPGVNLEVDSVHKEGRLLVRGSARVFAERAAHIILYPGAWVEDRRDPGLTRVCDRYPIWGCPVPDDWAIVTACGGDLREVEEDDAGHMWAAAVDLVPRELPGGSDYSICLGCGSWRRVGTSGTTYWPRTEASFQYLRRYAREEG